jgi:hypothetical protein
MQKKTVDTVITEEYMQKIRSFAAIRPEERFNYIPSVYRTLPIELQPIFVLQPISGEDILRFSDSMRGEVFVEGGKAQINVKHGEYTISVVKKGLKEWNNYYDLSGNIIDYVPGIINNLPRELLEELSEAITSKSRLTDEELLGLK